MGPKPGVVSIGQVARATGLSERQIRYYERKGIVRPERTPGGHRVFRPEEVERLKALAAWLHRGYTLAEAEARLSETRPERRLEELPARDAVFRPDPASLYPLRGHDPILRRIRERDGDG
ncbi:MAG: MerR family transcriptional regulator [Clostridia bacterium]|nr:MerR family transcriptional regulator [Clostridia bacterium]